MKKLTPLLTVDAIEPCLPFWMEHLGFEKTTEVPQDDALGFVILVRDQVEVMLQSRASIAADLAPLAEGPYRSMLYIEVEDLDPILAAITAGDLEVVVPERTTFYGAREVFLRDPAGNFVGFAQHGVG